MKKFVDFYGYKIFQYSSEFEKERFNMVRTGRDCYFSLCDKFGAMPEDIEWELFINGPDTNSAGFCTRIPATGKIIVAINVAHIMILPTDTFGRVIPHEVAHAFARTIYPDKSIGHGEEWKDIMNFMGVSDYIFTGYYPGVMLEIDKFENSL